MKKSRITITVLCLLLIFSSLGAGMSILTEKLGARIDLTEERLYTLSEETKRILKDVEKPVTVTVWAEESDYPLIVRNLLRSYAAYCPKIQVEYRDPYAHPEEVRALRKEGLSATENDIVMHCGEKSRVLTLESMYKMNAAGDTVKSLAAEQVLTSAADALLHGDREKVSFTDGHGETVSSALENLFRSNHYDFSLTELSVIGIPEGTVLLVVCAPKNDFSEEEISLLEDFTNDGGSVLCFFEPGSSGLLNLSEFLADRGIGLTDDVMREPSLYISSNPLNIAATYTPHPICSVFRNSRNYAVVPSCAAVEQLYQKKGKTETAEILRTSPKAVGSESGETGSRSLCVGSERTITAPDGETLTSRLAVFGSGRIYGDDLLGEEKLANHTLLRQTVSWLCEEDDLLDIPAKNLETDILPVSAGGTRLYIALAAVGVPVLLLLAGLTLFIRRRRA